MYLLRYLRIKVTITSKYIKVPPYFVMTKKICYLTLSNTLDFDRKQ